MAQRKLRDSQGIWLDNMHSPSNADKNTVNAF